MWLIRLISALPPPPLVPGPNFSVNSAASRGPRIPQRESRAACPQIWMCGCVIGDEGRDAVADGERSKDAWAEMGIWGEVMLRGRTKPRMKVSRVAGVMQGRVV